MFEFTLPVGFTTGANCPVQRVARHLDCSIELAHRLVEDGFIRRDAEGRTSVAAVGRSGRTFPSLLAMSEVVL
jgi:hypothetical protein